MKVELCPHHSVEAETLEDAVRLIRFSDRSMLEHVARCLPPGELKIALAKLIAERTFKDVILHTLPPQNDQDWKKHLHSEYKRLGLVIEHY